MCGLMIYLMITANTPTTSIATSNTDVEAVFPSTPMHVPLKTYSKSDKSKVCSPSAEVGRRSNRLSKKPRLSFAKLAKVGIDNEESDEESVDVDDSQITTDDFPATVTDPSVENESNHNDDIVTAMVREPVEGNDPSQELVSGQTSLDTIAATQEITEDSVQDEVASTVFLVRTSQVKEGGQSPLRVENQAITVDQIIQEQVGPRVEILQVEREASLDESTDQVVDIDTPKIKVKEIKVEGNHLRFKHGDITLSSTRSIYPLMYNYVHVFHRDDR